MRSRQAPAIQAMGESKEVAVKKRVKKVLSTVPKKRKTCIYSVASRKKIPWTIAKPWKLLWTNRYF